MKNTRLILIIFSILLTFNVVYSQTIAVDGYTYLEGQTNHDSIMITFERTAPSSLYDTAYTDNSGYFSKSIQNGIYDIDYTKNGYLTINYVDINLYSNYTFADTTLLQGIELGGQLSGIINPGIYYIIDDIEITNGNTLTIEPGVTMLFYQDVAFDINGLLIAEGNETDSIKFTKYTYSINWNGIDFNDNADDNSILSYCLIEYRI